MFGSWLGPFRETARERFFELLRSSLLTDDGRRILVDALDGSLSRPVVIRPSDEIPYPDLGRPSPAGGGTARPILVTGRFRSGSTLFWNIFRHVPGCTSFYEPLNERRWFDPSARGGRVDQTHLGVSDYWREYDGLAHLGEWYDERWIRRQLYMDETSWEPALRSYIQALIDAAPQTAVLQFNRVDFRLPWLRRNFPTARLIHVFRHPRDQWCSSLVDVKRFARTGTIEEFAAHDHFYLLTWATDLSYVFPVLDPRRAEHPYDLFYLIWRLSYIFGRTHCDASFCFETICDTPEKELQRLMQASGIEDYDIAALKALVVPQKPRWQEYADQGWFAAREARCESLLAQMLNQARS